MSPPNDTVSSETSRREYLELAGIGGTLVTGGAVGGYLAMGGRAGDDGSENGHHGDGADHGHRHEAALALVPPEDATHVADGGRWNDPDTWREGTVPDDAARVHVPEHAAVSLTRRDGARLKTVRVDGRLSFATDRDTHLTVETLVTSPTGVLEIGTDEDPIEPDAEARLTIPDFGPIDEGWDPTRVSRGIVTMGPTRMAGAETTSHAECETPPTAGDRTLELATEPENWNRGDRLVVAGLDPAEREDEEVVVEAVDGRTVTIDRELQFDHVPPAADLATHVLTLDRNVRLESASSEPKRRGHLMFATGDVAVSNVGVYGFGRTEKARPITNPEHGVPPSDDRPNPKGRYALHFHQAGIRADVEPAVVRGVLVHGSPGWGIVNHHSTVEVTDSATYDVFGAGFVAEAGTERGAFRRNLALRSTGSGETGDSRQFREDGDEGQIDDFGHGGHGFWLQGPGVALEENVAAGHRHFAFVYWTRALVDRELEPGEEIGGTVGGVRNFPVEHVDGQERLLESDRVHEGLVASSFVKLRPFRDNVAYASAGGLEITRHQFTRAHNWTGDWSVIDGFTAHSLGPFETRWGAVVPPDEFDAQGGNAGITLRYSHNIRIRNARLLGPDDDRPPTDGVEYGTDDEALARADSVGLTRNDPFSHVTVEDSAVEGFARGIKVPHQSLCHVADCDLANALDVDLEAGGSGGGWPWPQTVWLEGGSFDSGDPSIGLRTSLEGDLYGLFTDRGGIRLNDREVFLDAQRPDFVPVPDAEAAAAFDEESLEAVEGHDRERSVDDLIGKTNRELADAYDVAVGGRLAPESARSDDRIEGGLLQAPSDQRPTRAVWLEAHEGTLTEPFAVGEDGHASGRRYVSADGHGSWGEVPEDGRARYEFTVDEGDFECWGRFETPDGYGTVWVRIDDGEWLPWEVGARRGYEWFPLTEAESDDVHVESLAGGDHELEIAYRKGATRLDKLLVTGDGTTPVRTGE